MTTAGLRLAIIGGGPRAAYALDWLARLKAGGQQLPALIDVYEPRPVLGTGPAYELDQPDWILLNLPAQAIDLGFDIADSAVDYYPPRAEAGRFLAELAAKSIEALRPTPVRHLAQQVTALSRDGSGFAIADAGIRIEYDAVLLATGHASAWPGQLPRTSPASLPALPVRSLLAAIQRLAPERVCIRGASLTAIDAALTLSEGLGGHFEPADSRPSGLNFRPGARELCLTMASRTGRLMDVKTESAVLRRYRSAEAAAPLLAAFADTAEPADIGALIRSIAVAILTRVRGTDAEADGQVRAGWQGLGESGPLADARTSLERSLAQARGERPPDARWAIGQAWRCAYPRLVRQQQRLAGDDLAGPLGWPDYHRWARELERLAFGPPPINAAKMLALMEAGRLSVTAAGDEAFHDHAAGFDLVVDAVTAPPGVRDVDDPLWRQLREDGLIVVAPYGRGVLVNDAAGCLDRTGAEIVGLSVIGRATEDVVLGNDTLVRTMHTDLERWANRLCRSRELVR